MQIKLNKKMSGNVVTTSETNINPQNGGSVKFAPQMKKISVFVDQWGNEIDPRTKKIIKPKEE